MRPPDAVFDGPSLPGVEFLEIGGHGLRISGCRADHWISFSFVNEPHAAIEGVSLKRLDQQARQLEVWAKAPSFEAVLAEERQASPVYGCAAHLVGNATLVLDSEAVVSLWSA
jgi:hypothetical protein